MYHLSHMKRTILRISVWLTQPARSETGSSFLTVSSYKDQKEKEVFKVKNNVVQEQASIKISVSKSVVELERGLPRMVTEELMKMVTLR